MQTPVLIPVSRNIWETPDHRFRVEKIPGHYSIFAAQPDGSWEWVTDVNTLEEARRLIGK